MKLLSICALLGMVVPASAQAADARPARPDMNVKVPPYDLNTRVFDFPTGLRVMMQSDRSHPVVMTWMLVNHGTADDPEGKEETAHFVEHMWFRSKHGKLPPVMSVIQDLGSDFNATTRNDWTDYRTVASNDYLPLMLRLESLRLTNFYEGVTEDEIDVEREVIRNEWRRRNEQNPYGLFFDFMYEAIYPDGHGYHDHSTHGSIDNIKLKDLQGYVDKYYKTENTTVFVVGDFDIDESASLIFENFAPELLHTDLTSDMYFFSPKPGIEDPDSNNPEHWLTGAWDPATYNRDASGACNGCKQFQFSVREGQRLTDERPPVPPVGSTEVVERQGPVTTKTVVVGWSLPGGFRSDHQELEAVGRFANAFVAPAFADERRRRQVGDVGCLSQAEIQNTTVACYVEVRDKKLDPLRLRDKVLDQLPEMWNQEMFQTQGFRQNWQRSKMEGVAQTLLSLDGFAQSFGGRADVITPFAHYTGEPKAHSEAMASIMSLDVGKISRLAYEHLKRNRAATLIITPLDEEDIDIGSDHSSYKGASATDQVVESSDDLSTVTTEQIANAYVAPDLEDLVDYTLDNGLRVIVLPHGEAPVVQTSMVMRRDETREPKALMDFVSWYTEAAGNDPLPIAASASYPLYAGVSGVTGATSFSKPLRNPNNVWQDAFRMSFTAPSGNLDGALWLLREEVETARAVVEYKSLYVEEEEKAIQRNWGSRAWHISRLQNNFLYPGHPNGQEYSWGDYEALKAWGNTDVESWIGAHFRPDNATLLIVGNVDATEAKKQAERFFAGWQPRRSAAEPPKGLMKPDMPSDSSKIVIFDRPGATQTQTNMTCRLNYNDPEQEAAVNVLSSLLRTRTFTQLRVKEGLAYSPGAFSGVRSDDSAVLTFYSLATNSGVGRTMEFFQEAIAEVEAGEVNEEEVTLHKLRTARRLGVGAQSLSQMTGKLTEVVRKGKDWDFASDRGSLIADIGADDLKELLQGCAAHTISTLEGPKDVIAPQLDELGLEYEVYEWRAAGEELLWEHDPKEAKKQEKKRQKKAKKDARAKKKAKKGGEDGESSDLPAGHP
ncbi:MAG: insulinase family protein [Myxococcales bacterium]|nr:insulinase family protein [Myxococcales bacterium]